MAANYTRLCRVFRFYLPDEKPGRITASPAVANSRFDHFTKSFVIDQFIPTFLTQLQSREW